MAAKKNGKDRFSNIPEYSGTGPIALRTEFGGLLRSVEAVRDMLDAAVEQVDDLDLVNAQNVMAGCSNLLAAAIGNIRGWSYNLNTDVFVLFPDHPLRKEAFKAIGELDKANFERVQKEYSAPVAA